WRPAHHFAGVISEHLRESRIDQDRETRTASVMEQTGNRPDAEGARPLEPIVRPRPVRLGPELGRKQFPEQRKSQGPQTDCRETIQIVRPIPMTVAFKLVEEPVPDAINGAFNPAPKLE